MPGGNRYLLDTIKMELRNHSTGELLPVWIDVYDSSLARKWLAALNDLIAKQYHLEKNYCFFGFAEAERDGQYLCEQINDTIRAINSADIGYHINDVFTLENTLESGEVGHGLPGRKLIQSKFNNLHRYFEDLQGVSGAISPFYNQADSRIRWHIRQLNLLCHEYESWALSYRKSVQAPEWQRPSQLMCWLNAPRFVLDEEDYELFGVDTIARPTGGVFVGVNKAIGKHHWEVFHDEGRDSRIDELTTTTLKSQTEAAGDFDIEWAVNPGLRDFMQRQLQEFRGWLTDNGFDPEDKSLTIGHPQVGQVDLQRTFGTEDAQSIWPVLNQYLDVFSIETSNAKAEYPYHWSDSDYIQQQIEKISKGN